MKAVDWRDALRTISPDSLGPTAPEEESPIVPQTPKAPAPLLRIIVERRSGGKIATIITGFDYDDPRAEEVASQLKRKLAVGGSVRDGEILLQGDRRQRVADVLRQMGYKVK